MLNETINSLTIQQTTVLYEMRVSTFSTAQKYRTLMTYTLYDIS